MNIAVSTFGIFFNSSYIIFSIILSFFIVRSCNQDKIISEKTNLISSLNDTIKIWKDKNGISHSKTEVIKTSSISDFLKQNVKDKETKEPATELTAKLIQNAIQKGLLLENCGTAGNVVRFLAPLTMTDEQMEKGLEIFEASLKEAMEA